jgi:hypothetical protein
MAGDGMTLAADLLADWLEKKAPKIWWFLDGEREVSSAQALPAQGEDLARAFRRHGGRLVVVQDEPGSVKSGDVTDLDALDELLESDDDERALELAWLVKGKPSAPSLLVESVVNEDAKELPPEAWRA